MKDNIVIHWFRQDLRLSDNPALHAAAKSANVLPIYILDDINPAENSMGEASRVWLHHSLLSLGKSLANNLCLYSGDPSTLLPQLCQQHRITKVFWNRCYEGWRIARDKKIKQELLELGVEVISHNGSLLWEPWEINKSDGSPYKVFTPFYRKGCLAATAPRCPIFAPERINFYKDNSAVNIESLHLLPEKKWGKSIINSWCVGEAAAQLRLESFLARGIDDYKEGRNFPAKNNVSKLSPHLHFGEISPNQAWYSALDLGEDKNISHFCSELGWREFSYNQLYFQPQLWQENLQQKFDNFPWSEDKALLLAWQQGLTGIPMVDAGMRQLWQTGYMHNRVRMVVGSFLVKNLLLDWRHGERWFWNTLFDADLASNSASWQWVAGCGYDAAPYFRIFNPVTQGQKFDPCGKYVREFIPELAALPDKYLFSPWEAPATILSAAGVILGQHYPKPIVDLKTSRESALGAFSSLKQITND